MYYQQNPFFLPNINQMQIPPCMRNIEDSEMMMPNTMTNPSQASPESSMPEYQLEDMYPQTYYIIFQEVIIQCDKYDKECCGMNIPTRQEIERMANNITMKVESEVETNLNMGTRETESRQLGFGGRNILGDFATALLLREFFQRRHRPHRPRRHFPYHRSY